MKTRISVIIPVYNVQEFLKECIDSVLNQTINQMELSDGYERNLQIILIDDGSTDDSARIAKEYDRQYENVQYIYEENQGLGHARNYGCTFVEGDYIIFLDSDDLVPPKAYERMYNAAVKNDSDMTIGGVWRFNSNGYWQSNIHRIAFSGTERITHITKSPELFYDTTSWNKLIKRSFWEERGFEFPEGILYEDIPVTIPMHYLANNVSIVYENCYLWRVREGLSKSITQTTDDLKNLNDRLFVMKLVDGFFKNHVKEKQLFEIKEKKWLQIDLMIFINKLKSMTKEESLEVMDILCNYIEENISDRAYEILNEIDQIKYKYLLAKEYRKLVDIINFESEELEINSVFMKDNHLTMNVPGNIFGKEQQCVDRYISEGRLSRYIKEVSLDKKCLSITGFMLIPGIADKNFEDRKYSFSLVNSETNKTIPLQHKDVPAGDLSTFDIKYGDSFSYEAAGYQVSIPYTEIRDCPELVGENRILVSFTQNGITHNLFAGIAKKNVRTVSEDKAIMRGDNYFCIKYDLNNELIIDISLVEYRYDKVSVEENQLCIHSPEFHGDLFMCYEKDSINDECIIPMTYEAQKGYYAIPVEKLRPLEGQIRYKDGTPAVHKWKRLMVFGSEKGQCVINALRDYHFDIRKIDDTTIVSEISNENSIINIKANLNKTGRKDEIPKSAVLYFKNKRNEEEFSIVEGKLNVSDGSMEVNFSFDINKKEVTQNLYQGFHDVYVRYQFETHEISTSLYLLSLYKYTHNTKLYDYEIYRGKNGTLRVHSIRKWKSSEDNEVKRNHLVKTKYKFFRHFPIKKKRILFESMWGDKYSCNPRYLYEYIDENHPEYECIWSLTDEHTPIKGNGIRVRRESLKYLYYLATSKYFVNNVNFHDHYVKRQGQIEIQTMHGTPLKTLGLDVPGDFKSKKQKHDYIKRCKRWDYLTVQSDFVADIAGKCFLFDKKVLKTGYPRTDILYTKNNSEDISKLKKKMGLPQDKKVILYAPTWRIRNQFELMLDLEAFKKKLSDEYVLILRLHHFSVLGWVQPEKDDFVYDLSRYDSAEELYLVSDVMITDYSSVMFDYSILNRPIILFTYDMNEYKEKLRGLYIDIEDDKPGPILYSSEDVLDAIVRLDEIEEEYKPYREKFREKFVQYECGNSSEKVFNEVMKNE